MNKYWFEHLNDSEYKDMYRPLYLKSKLVISQGLKYKL